jgi:DNA-binding response OmpR family regulator
MRILIAEDERDLNKILAQRLMAEHYSVDSCMDGEAALDYLAGAEYDVVILDIMMPKKDGLSVLREIRQKNKHVPVLLLTAKDSVEDPVRGLDAGANDYLVKPVDKARLMSVLRKYCHPSTLVL